MVVGISARAGAELVVAIWNVLKQLDGKPVPGGDLLANPKMHRKRASSCGCSDMSLVALMQELDHNGLSGLLEPLRRAAGLPPRAQE